MIDFIGTNRFNKRYPRQSRYYVIITCSTNPANTKEEEMQRYQFERIYSEMEKEFGKMKKGTEDSYAMLMLPMEGNALKIHRANPKSNSRRLREAIALVLFDVKSRYTQSEYDVESFRDEDNARLEQALLMAFDPFTNDEVREVLGEQTPEELHEYYRKPVMCLLRIKTSIDTWEKAGPNGYFEFVENYMGAGITGSEMHFSVSKGLQ